LLPGADPDLVDIMLRQVTKRFEEILMESEVVDVQHKSSQFQVDIKTGDQVQSRRFEQVLVAVGRVANTDNLDLEKAGLSATAAGKIAVDTQCRTAVPHIFAIGDVVEGPMLAHKATREGKVAAEVIAGHTAVFDNKAIPAAVFTDPEIAWTGLTEREAKERSISIAVGRFPLTALGRAWTLGRTNGMVKIISDPQTQKVLGVGMVGPQASELIAEGTLALEMGATLRDLMVTIHPHPTLSEAIMEAAEVAAGSPIHIHPRKK
jgi:dihydrolipoamide dehydrogenase